MMPAVLILLSILLLPMQAIAQPAATPKVDSHDHTSDTDDSTRDLNVTTSRALALLHGHRVPMNVQEGLRLLRLAAGKAHPEAMYHLGVILAAGKIADKDIDEAVGLLKKAAEASFAPAMVELGLRYNIGDGVSPDPSMAANWFRKAAGLGNPNAQVNLGFLYQQGRGVERNDVAAVAWYRKAADQGSAPGIHNMAAMLDSGRGVERKNPEEAADLMMKSLDGRNEFSRRQMTENSRAWSIEFRQALQRRLAEAGFFKGPIDGEFAATTSDAIVAYVDRTR